MLSGVRSCGCAGVVWCWCDEWWVAWWWCALWGWWAEVVCGWWVAGECAAIGCGEGGGVVGVEGDLPAVAVDEAVVIVALCRVRDYAGLVGSCLVSGGGCVRYSA